MMRAAMVMAVALGLVSAWGQAVCAQSFAWPDLVRETGPKLGGGAADAAVIVGVDDYVFAPDVPGAADNALAWSRFLHTSRGVPLKNIALLQNAQGTRENVEDALKQAAGRVGRGGTVWFVFVGHGAAAPGGRGGVLIGADAQQTAKSIYARSVAQSWAIDVLAKGRQARTVVVLDTCFSGRGQGGEPVAKGLQPLVPVEARAHDKGMFVFTAGTSDQFAGPLPGAGRPAFSYLLLGALRGWADADKNGEVTAQEARDYTDGLLQFVLRGRRRQTPQLYTQRPDMALIVRRGRAVRLESGPDVFALSAPTVQPVRPKKQKKRPARGESSGEDAWDVGVIRERVVRFVASSPGASVTIDGAQVCATTPCSRSVAWGARAVEFGSACFATDLQQLKVDASGPSLVEAKLTERPAGVEVKAVSKSGDSMQAEVWVDGVRLGVTPGRFKVGVCAKTLEVRAKGLSSAVVALKLQERQVTPIRVTLEVRPVNHEGMVRVPAGRFWRGSDRSYDEKPEAEVVLGGFWIDAHEVTTQTYAACVDAGACTVPVRRGRDPYNWSAEGPVPSRMRHPINGVDWGQAKAYCAWVGKALPTEAQWEKAARGVDGLTYPWGEAEASCRRAVMADLEGEGMGCGERHTWEVGSKALEVSPYGAYDMAGNVAEWTADWYDAGHYRTRGSQQRDPAGPGSGTMRAVRGGSWLSSASELRAAYRHYAKPNAGSPLVGFRCVAPEG